MFQFKSEKNLHNLRWFGLVAVLSVLTHSAFAETETIEFSEEELAAESVLPVFDKTIAVRNRAIVTSKRLELGLGTGLNLAEPLYKTLTFNLNATYHLNEEHGIGVFILLNQTGLSDAGSDLKNGKGLVANTEFDASKAPQVENLYFLNYQFTAYYGKISFTKETTANLSVYGLLGAGMVQWTDESTLGGNIGIGQKIYFGERFSVRTDFLLAVYPGPDPTDRTGSDNSLDADGPTYDSGDFESTFYFRPYLTIGATLMF
jgi:outer membrane beta-barrel protein